MVRLSSFVTLDFSFTVISVIPACVHVIQGFFKNNGNRALSLMFETIFLAVCPAGFACKLRITFVAHSVVLISQDTSPWGSKESSAHAAVIS